MDLGRIKQKNHRLAPVAGLIPKRNQSGYQAQGNINTSYGNEILMVLVTSSSCPVILKIKCIML
jgi:hypothetical protein